MLCKMFGQSKLLVRRLRECPCPMSPCVFRELKNKTPSACAESLGTLYLLLFLDVFVPRAVWSLLHHYRHTPTSSGETSTVTTLTA